MPIYEYKCKACSHEFEELQGIKEKALRKCPECGKLQLYRKIGVPAIRFKGPGFYVNDYPKEDKSRKGKDE